MESRSESLSSIRDQGGEDLLTESVGCLLVVVSLSNVPQLPPPGTKLDLDPPPPRAHPPAPFAA